MYKKQLHLHFMGIGGIGMSGIAKLVFQQGYHVSGCDLGSSPILGTLAQMGMTVQQGHCVDHIAVTDVLVYSSAVSYQHDEVSAALKKGIPVIPRAIMLAELMRTKFSVAIAGSHGKTTTTSLLAHLMLHAQRSPTIIIGGVLKDIAQSAQLGDSDILIAEADESDRSLLYLNPTMAVLTNINFEHLNTYRDLDDVKTTFKNFLARLPFYGKAFVCIDDENVRSILPMSHVQTITYGLSSQANLFADLVEVAPGRTVCDVYVTQPAMTAAQESKQLLGRITVPIPGEHNVVNALAAIAVCREFDVPFDIIADGLKTFQGVQRRFELKGTFRGAEIFDDYGHHPVEIDKTLIVAARRTRGKLHVVFQPHRYSRTHGLWDDFVQLFSNPDAPYCVDYLYVTSVYPAQEVPLPAVTGKLLAEAIQIKKTTGQVIYCSTDIDVIEQVKQHIKENDLLITVGAGHINKVGTVLVKMEKNK